VAASDEMAFGVLAAARDLGLGVPGDLSVTGLDDHELAEVLDLTTVRQQVDLQGRRAGEILMAQLLEGCPPGEGDTTLPVELVVRDSTAPPSAP
jgi:DNA-binding LacI/PurR family transcriptional regulator